MFTDKAGGRIGAVGAVRYQISTRSAFGILGNSISFSTLGTIDGRNAGETLRQGCFAFNTGKSISIQEISINTGITLVLPLTTHAVSKASSTAPFIIDIIAHLASTTDKGSEASSTRRNELTAEFT